MADYAGEKAQQGGETMGRAQFQQTTEKVRGLQNVVAIGSGQSGQAQNGLSDIASQSAADARQESATSFNRRSANLQLLGGIAGAGANFAMGKLTTPSSSGAGLNLQGAINQGVLKGPKGVLRDEFQRVLRDIRAGKPRAESLRNMAGRINEPGVTNFIASIIQAERMGMSLGPVLRAQADQQRIERFLRAEKLAMEAPVKMLFPLIAFIFPCTFIVLFFPIVIKFMNAGI